MGWQERMNRAIAWIEAHLTEELEWEQAAREAHCSLFHFLRMFEVILGITAGDYVRRRRLSRAATELSAGETKIIDLALKYGYESPDAFTRAFRKLFDCTPTEARQPGRRLRSYGPISFSIVLKGAEAMNYRIEKKARFSMTGLCFRVSTRGGQNLEDIPHFWEQSMANGSYQKLMNKVPAGSRLGVTGICAEMDEKMEAFTYFIAIETPGDRNGLPEGCRALEVPAATWGIFESRGPLPTAIQEAWKRIWAEWMPSSGYEAAEGPELEVYGPGNPNEPDYSCEIWIPLRKNGS